MRETPLSKAVLELLEQQNRPVSVPDLKAMLAEKALEPNKTTLYRMLERLQQEGVIRSVLLDNKTAYFELAREQHHHFVCQDCDLISCVSDPDLEAKIQDLEDTLKSKGLEVKGRQFTLSGTCSDCK